MAELGDKSTYRLFSIMFNFYVCIFLSFFFLKGKNGMFVDAVNNVPCVRMHRRH